MTPMDVLIVVERFFLYWLAYSFAGWVWETGLSVVLRKRFEDRGMLNGPICPIYGFGGLLVVVLLHDVNNPLSRCLASGVLACTLESASSWAIEKLYHMRFWDYSGKPFNINGRVYLNGFLAFGAGATCIKLVVQPWMSDIVRSWPIWRASRRRGTVVRRGGNRCGHHPGRSAQSRLASGEGQRGHQGAQIAADQTDRHTHQRGRRAVARNVRQTARAGGAGV